ncbi:hypothetical protein F9L33_14680 [Amylibacter sp. SFDW26]|uniref:hypothetical protein n=1 Tax=Amylibacter sp. SFDW26 TaxID=2652722 RepID=UPI00126236C2|nr:hypothetical protein [Amylibacter sp. SFDW26]KAB7610138.1 hypothetical protein F9L33_14680 [Amylibacter sp. SFDW26]
MARKDFAMISTSLPYSRKYRAGSVLAKLVYNHLHISNSMNYLGIFQYQDIVLAHEIDINPDELDAALNELAENGLIEMHKDQEIIRIIGWFHKANGATNASHANKLITDFCELDIPGCEAYFKALAEFAVATLKRSLKWKKDAENLRQELKPLLLTLIRDHGEAFAIPMLDEIKQVGETLQYEIHSLIPNLLKFEKDTLSTPCTTGGGDTRRRRDETRLRQNLNEKDTKTKTSSVLENDGFKPLTEHQVPNVEEFRISESKSKRPSQLASEAAKKSLLAMGASR